MSRTSFYANWETNEAFWADLVDYVCKSALPLAAENGQALPTDIEIDISTLRTATRRGFELGLERRELPLMMLLWSKSSDRRVAEALRRGYDAMLAPLVPHYEQFFARMGREARPPLSMRDIATIFVALSDGLSARYQFDPTGAPVSLFEDAMVALIPAVTRSAQPRDSRPIDHVISDFIRPGIDPPAEPPGPPRRRQQVDEAVVDAFDRLLNDRGYRGVTIADVAARARTSPTTIYEHFGSKAALGILVASRYAQQLAERLGALPAGTPIEDCLVVVYDHVVAHHRVFDAAYSARLEDPLSVPAPDIRNPIVRALAERIAGEHPVNGDAAVLAAVWWRSMLTAALLADVPATGAELARLLVHGLAPAGDATSGRATLRR